MQPAELNARIVARGRSLFSAISGEKPSLFDTSSWTGKVMDWSMQNEQFKIQLFRFVDVFPSLTTPRQLTDHIREYFGEEKDLPQVLSSGARMAGMFGSLGGALLGKMISANIQRDGPSVHHRRACRRGGHTTQEHARRGFCRRSGRAGGGDTLGR